MTVSEAKPNILFYCATGRGLGLGHLYRCRMLLRELSGPASLIAAKPDNDARRFLDSPPVPWQAVEPHLADGGLGSRLAEMALQAGAQVVALDCKDTSRELVLAVRSSGLTVVGLEDLGPGRQEADLLLDPHIQPESREAVYSGRAECCFGPGWALLDPSFARQRNSPVAPGREDGPLTVAVSLGGSDPAGLTGRVIEALAGIDCELNIEVVLGPAAWHMELPAAGDHTMRVHRALPSLAGLLRRSGLAFVGGGITMFEALCLGLPAVVVPQNEEQHRNASRLAARGALLIAPPLSAAGAEKVLKEIATGICTDAELRYRLTMAGAALVDGSAVERLASKINTLIARIEQGKLAPVRR